MNLLEKAWDWNKKLMNNNTVVLSGTEVTDDFGNRDTKITFLGCTYHNRVIKDTGKGKLRMNPVDGKLYLDNESQTKRIRNVTQHELLE